MPSSLRTLLVLASTAVLAACATSPGTVQTGGGPAGPAGPRADGSAYGYFLAGQAAIEAGDSRAAAEYFARAQAEAPDQATIRDRAFTAALFAGDLQRASQLAEGVDKDNTSLQSLVQLSRAVELMADNKPGPAYAILAATAPTAPSAGVSSLLAPWAAAAAGKWEAALVLPDSKDRVFRLIALLDQAQLFERAKRYEEAETAFKAAQAEKAGKPIVGPTFAAFLERRGRQKEALAIYDELLAAYPADVQLQAGRARAAAKGKPPAMATYREGAAQALMLPAGALLADKQNQAALIYLHFVLRLDDGREDALLLMADLLNQNGDKAGARAAYARIPSSSPKYVEARSRLAWSYQEDDKARALQLAQEVLAERPDDAEAQLTTADLLRVNERYPESIAVLDRMIEKAGARVDWRLHYMRGAAYERAGRWPEAEKDLQRALALKPDEPELLNYLGYAWVSRGQNVQTAMGMIKKAVEQSPDNGAYIDSLGWAYYQLGDYKAALERLERAAELEAGDAEVNDHLGDVYWKLGRKDEARFKWRAVLSLEPDAEIRKRAETKLASPQGADAVGSARAVASQ